MLDNKFQGIPRICTPDEYLDIAFKAAKDSASTTRSDVGGKGKSRLQKSKTIEAQRIYRANKAFQKAFSTMLDAFPSIDRLPPFYLALVKATLEYAKLKHSLGAIQWASQTLGDISYGCINNIRRAQTLPPINGFRTEFYGRASSVVKKIRQELDYLEQCRKTMRRYPVIRTDVATVVIAGFPNVGKTTLLKALTGSAPEIAPYPFTTQELKLGYYKNSDGTDVQVIDTPGLLDRPLEERNPVERHAILALSHLANLIVFVIDPTETCGFTRPDQDSLLQSIRKEFQKPFIIALNKADLQKTFQANMLSISADKSTGIDELKKHIQKQLVLQPNTPANKNSANN